MFYFDSKLAKLRFIRKDYYNYNKKGVYLRMLEVQSNENTESEI